PLRSSHQLASPVPFSSAQQGSSQKIRKVSRTKRTDMKSKFLKALLMFCLTAAAALAGDVKSDYDRSYNLSRLRAFKFADQSQRPAKDALAENEIVAKRIHGAIQRNLENLGMDPDVARADFVIVYHGAVRQQTRVTAIGRPRLGPGSLWVDNY